MNRMRIGRMRIGKEWLFEAAHHLPYVPDGHKCKRPHGHSYRLTISFEGIVDERAGWFLDYGALKPIGEWVKHTLDHRNLNDLIENPTAENLCLYVCEQLPVGEWTPYICAVRINETAKTFAEVSVSFTTDSDNEGAAASSANGHGTRAYERGKAQERGGVS